MRLSSTPVLLALTFFTVTAVSLPKLDNAFVFDDLYVIAEGTVIHDPANIPAVFRHHTLYSTRAEGELLDPPRGVDTYRPVTLLTFFVDSAFSGRAPIAYHIDNLLAHLACIGLVFALARRILPRAAPGWAVFAAAFVGLSPEPTEAHVWINGRSDLYACLFGVAALLAWERAISTARPGRAFALGPLALAMSLFALALLSKEIALMLLVPAFAWPRTEDAPALGVGARLVRAAPLALVGLAYLVVRVVVLRGLAATATSQQSLHAVLRLPSLWLDGIVALLVPTNVYLRSMFDDYNDLGVAWLLVRAVVVVLAVIAVVRLRRRAPIVAWSLLGFAAVLAPAAVITTTLWPGFGRYLYVPSAFVGIGLAWLADAAWQRIGIARRRWVVGGAVGYLTLLTALSAQMVAAYQDEESLYTHVIEAAPHRAHGYAWLGKTMLDRGRFAEAIALLSRAESRAPYDPGYLESLGEAHLAQGDLPGTLSVVATGIGRFPRDTARFHALAARAWIDVEPDLAARHVLQCDRDCPRCAACRTVRAELLSDPRRAAALEPRLEALASEPELLQGLVRRDAPSR